MTHRIKSAYKNNLIEASNKKLRYFHMLVAFVLFFDFYLTGFIIGNYQFFLGNDPEFVNHRSYYQIICTVQIIDIILNFFKLEPGQKKIKNTKNIMIRYLSGNFVPDVVAVIPYSVVYPKLIFLRYLKLLKYQIYFFYVEEFVVEQFNNIMNGAQIKIFISLLRLIF